MPMCTINWMGNQVPDGVLHHLRAAIQPYVSEMRDHFTILAYYRPNTEPMKKVILCKERVFIGLQAGDLLILIPENALDIRELIYIMDNDKSRIDMLSLDNILSVMV
jgi:hypothetical protein